jgi:hypothetical protein
MKKIMKKNEITAILFINLRVYEKLNCLINDWVSHSMNNSIVYEKSFNSNKESACVARSEQCYHVCYSSDKQSDEKYDKCLNSSEKNN